MTPLEKYLVEKDACRHAIEWARGKTLCQAWEQCERGDWMLWLAVRMIDKKGWPTRQEIVRISCWVARRTQKYWTDKTDTRPMDAIEATERWVDNPTEENLTAVRAALRVVGDAYLDAAWEATRHCDAARDVARVARVAFMAARAASAAAGAAILTVYDAVEVAAETAWATAYDDEAGETAWAAEHKAICDHIRKTLKIGSL